MMIRDLAAMRRSLARIRIKSAHGEAPDERGIGVVHDKVRKIGSSGQPPVTMMQAADQRKGNDLPGAARLDCRETGLSLFSDKCVREP